MGGGAAGSLLPAATAGLLGHFSDLAGCSAGGVHEDERLVAGPVQSIELLLAMREISQRELREQGSGVVQKLGDELARLDAALLEFLPGRGPARRGA